MTSSTLSHHVGAHTTPFTGEASCEIDTCFCSGISRLHTVQGKSDCACCHHRTIMPLLTKRRLTSFIPFVVCLSNVHGDVVGISNLLNNDFADNHHSSGSPIWRVFVYYCCNLLFCCFNCFLCRGKPHEKCPLCQTNYLPEFKGIVCKICQVSFVSHTDMHVCMHAYTACVTFMYHLISSLPACLLGVWGGTRWHWSQNQSSSIPPVTQHLLIAIFGDDITACLHNDSSVMKVTCYTNPLYCRIVFN